MPLSNLSEAEIDTIITEIEGGKLPMVAFKERNLPRPYTNVLNDVRDKMNETDPNHFINTVQPLREAHRVANSAPGNKEDVILNSINRCKRHSNGIKNLLNRHGSLFKLDQLTAIEADLQAALADIAILKPDATND
jgi:hypothetical protein